MNQTLPLTDTLYRYLLDTGLREHPALTALREETATNRMAKMQIAPEQGQLLTFLAQMAGVRRYVEVGVFTGYSSLAMALTIPDDGEIIACDMSLEFSSIARRHWQTAGVANKISLFLQPGLVTLQAQLDQGRANYFDMMFIDADKRAYPDYYELGLQLVRPGGLIVLDNMFLSGRVADPTFEGETPGVEVIRQLNKALQHDQRVDYCLLPLGDGMTLLRKR